jgi:uncharacterized 2Fe-2S/4Fe-4S cluster protein (DUF4445 family)
MHNRTAMNHIVAFLPSGKSVSVPDGTLISDAAVTAGLSELHLPCGGRGTCGKCLVETIGAAGDENGRVVPACRTKVKSDLTIRIIADNAHTTMRIIADAESAHSHGPDDLSPLCVKVPLKVEAPTIDDNYSDLELLEKQLTAKRGPGTVSCSCDTLRTLADTTRKKNGQVTAVIFPSEGRNDIVRLEPGDTSASNYGIACDIGTTTVSLHLVNCANGTILGTRSDYNAQIGRGADVISRIDYARTPGRLAELRGLILSTVNRCIESVCGDCRVEPAAVTAMTIAGNCTMTHLFLGLPPRFIREHPYVPTVNRVPVMKAGELGLSVCTSAPVLFAPGVGSYVGGDITAGLLCTDMIDRNDRISLFIDIGTNGEIVIGNSEFLMTCACSAGPAFEGSGIKCGMRAGHGAIESFTINNDAATIDYSTIGDVPPEGICGSGLICLLGEMLLSGVVDRSGRFTGASFAANLTRIEGTPAFVAVPAEKTSSRKPIVVTESDIENLIRTKAAIYAACDRMLVNAGLDFGSIGRVLIAGGFGRYIDIEEAVRIGLLPNIDRAHFSYLGNTSLAGATLALLSEQCRRTLSSLPRRMTYVELSNDPRYMDSYVAELFLPHTDLRK